MLNDTIREKTRAIFVDANLRVVSVTYCRDCLALDCFVIFPTTVTSLTDKGLFLMALCSLSLTSLLVMRLAKSRIYLCSTISDLFPCLGLI